MIKGKRQRLVSRQADAHACLAGGGGVDRLVDHMPQVQDRSVAVQDLKDKQMKGDDRIVRIYSLARYDQTATLTAGFSISKAWESDLAESELRPLAVESSMRLRVRIRPFEIATVRVRPAATAMNNAS